MEIGDILLVNIKTCLRDRVRNVLAWPRRLKVLHTMSFASNYIILQCDLPVEVQFKDSLSDLI